jgi:NAD(P)-dependent dehydrogenase (short-subunit alcohol dehydrogenase family)/acyl carrier protein
LPAAGNALGQDALVAYQQTMRQFLALQERVMQQVLGGGAVALGQAPTQAISVMPAQAGIQSVEPQGILSTLDSRVRGNDIVRQIPNTAVAAPAFDPRATLLGIVAERTGYPAEMLRLDADLEADLGIDSIKRVEILGALQNAVPDALAQALRQQMERYTKARTLAAILAELDAAAPAATVVATAATTAAPAAVHAFDARATLLGIVAERTGYPAEMLRLDADLEADLGIDSIKRVEILGALQNAVPDALAQTLRQQMERYTKARTLAAILAELDDAAPTAATVTPAATATTARADAPTPRYVIRSRPAPLPPPTAALSGLALLLGGPDAIALPLQQLLQSRGMQTLRIAVDDPAALRDAVGAAQRQHGPMRALLHLSGLEPSRPDDLAAWRAAWRRDAMSLFHALQALDGELATARVLAASRLGGSMGRDAIGCGSATGGGANGLFNCLRQEYPQARLRAVDFDGQADDEIARLLVEELASNCAEPEVGYVGEQRLGYVTADQPLTASPFPAVSVTPSGDWVMLVTGGARGITAQIVEELVRPGMRVVLLGRSAAPRAEAAETAALADAALLKAGLLKQRLARGETPRPVDIDRDVARILADREIRANLARLADAGARVEYVACDVRDDDALRALIEDLYAKYGNIDAVLHGAGVIEDKLFADKTAESFERVLGTKLDAAFVLSQQLRPQRLKLLAFFTSVAGRYGNRGQGDYAAANETLNRLAWQLHREWPHTRVVAINWGPWDAGMASEAVRRALRERGIEVIPVAAGRRFFVDEIMYGPRHDVEIVAGAGPWSDGATADDAPGQPPAGSAGVQETLKRA